MTTSIKVYLSIVAFAAISLVSLMFYLEPKMIIPSLIGVSIFTLLIVWFYKIESKKSHEEQMRTARRNGKLAYIGIFVLTAIFFIAGAKHNNVEVLHFIRLWFGI